MFKRLLFISISLLAMFFISACTTETTVETYLLPDLTGMNSEEAQAEFESLGVTLAIDYEENESVENSLFIRYDGDYVIGDDIPIDSTVTAIFSINYPELPDFTGMNDSEITAALDDLGIDFIFRYETNADMDEDLFIRFGGEDEIGTTINDGHEVIIYISTHRLVLPDLTGMNQIQIFTAMNAAQITNYVIEIVTDNTVVDQTFSSYGDNFEPGDTVPSAFTITVYLGYNSEKYPDLTGMLIQEISETLDEVDIPYQVSYITNDNYPEDCFAGYVDVNVGDFYEGGVVTINLYQNTFTNNTTSLIISKYVDGGNDTSNQAIEIYNPTDSTVNLVQYHLAIYINGSFDIAYTIPFDDVQLQPGETYVIANSGANVNILAKADLISANLVFDGNDTVQLCFENGTYIDTIYNIGDRDFIMDNEVFVRNQDVTVGTRSYIFTQWHGFVPTYTEVLGTHPLMINYEIDFNLIARPYDDPLGGMDAVTLVYINDGDTASFTPGFLNDERVRFIGVDTPETYPYVDAWGLEAKAYTTLILNNAINIYIQSDPDIGTTDTYGRHLGLIWVDLGEVGLTIDILSSTGEVMRTEVLTGWILRNYHLVLNGYSYNYYGEDSSLIMNDRYIYRWFQEAEKFAEMNGLGVHEE